MIGGRGREVGKTEEGKETYKSRKPPKCIHQGYESKFKGGATIVLLP